MNDFERNLKNQQISENELLEYYTKKVRDIPELRICVSYREEVAVRILPYLMDNCDKNDDINKLIGPCMNLTQGSANPFHIKCIIEEWQSTT